MTTWMHKLENWFSAVAFAEAGEHKTALEIVALGPRKAAQKAGILTTLNKFFAASAFAEENCPDIAKEILGRPNRKPSFAETVGLRGVRVWYGKVPAHEASFAELVGLKGIRVRFGVVPL